MVDVAKKLSEFFDRQEYVELAYLYGSTANGRAGKLRDIDVAVFLDESLGGKERLDLQLKLISELAGILKTDKVDLVVMNDAPLSLQYEIIKDEIIKDEIIKANHPLLARNESRRIDLEHRILSRYLDRRYYEKRWAASFLRKVAEKGI